MRPLSFSLCLGLFLCLPAAAEEKAEKSPGSPASARPARSSSCTPASSSPKAPPPTAHGNVYFTDIPNEKIYKVDSKGKLTRLPREDRTTPTA